NRTQSATPCRNSQADGAERGYEWAVGIPSDKNFFRDPAGVLQCLFIQDRQQSASAEMTDHPLRIHVADQGIPRHRASADSFQRAIEAQATGIQRCIDLGSPVMVRRMEV